MLSFLDTTFENVKFSPESIHMKEFQLFKYLVRTQSQQQNSLHY